MEHNDLVVGGEAEIAFDPRAPFERGEEGVAAILDKLRTGVEPPMREAVRAGR